MNSACCDEKVASYNDLRQSYEKIQKEKYHEFLKSDSSDVYDRQCSRVRFVQKANRELM